MRKSLKRSSKKGAALTLAMIGCLSLPVFAEEKEAEVTVTREVLVTASRTEQELKETPTSAEVITREKIEAMGAQNVRDALRLAFNIDIMQNGMVGNKVSIRGMDTTHSLILVDGRRMAAEDTRETGNAYALDRINLDNVERIEIVRGPGSAMYGSDALGGVINIITKESKKAEGTIGFSAGNRLASTNLRYDTGKMGKWAWVIDANFQKVNDRMLPSGASNMYGPSEFYNIKGTYSITDNKKIDIFYERVNEHFKSYTTATSLSDYENDRDSFGLTYRGNGQKSNYEIRAYYNKLEKDQTQKNVSTKAVTDFDHAEYSTWVLEGRNSIQIADNHLLTFGGEYRTSKYRGTRLGSAGDNASTIDRHGINKSISKREIDYYAAYLQDEWQVSNKLLLIPSLRFDDSDKFGSNFSPKLGMTYKMSDNSRVKASYGKGFRAPSISELFMDFRGTMGGMVTNLQGNPDLKPEKADSWEISIEAEKNNNFGKLTYFHNDVKNLINMDYVMTLPPPPPPTLTGHYVNIDEARISGLEAEVGRHLNKNFTVKVAHTYLDAIDKSNNERLDGRARNKTTLQLHYTGLEKSGINAILWNEWAHDYVISGKDYNYSMLNFSINKKWKDGKYNAYFAINNIFDKQVAEISMYEGRIWRLGFNVNF